MMAPDERKALAQIVETADLVLIEDRWCLMVPADVALLDTLATFGAAGEDREPTLEDEKDEGEEDDSNSDNPADREAMTASWMPYDDDEDNGDREEEMYFD